MTTSLCADAPFLALAIGTRVPPCLIPASLKASPGRRSPSWPPLNSSVRPPHSWLNGSGAFRLLRSKRIRLPRPVEAKVAKRTEGLFVLRQFFLLLFYLLFLYILYLPPFSTSAPSSRVSVGRIGTNTPSTEIMQGYDCSTHESVVSFLRILGASRFHYFAT